MDKLSLLVMNILVCNSIEVLNGEYQGVSQDELCFLKALRKHGYELLEREDNFVLLSVKGVREKIRVLYTLEFSSKRQMMSVLVERKGRYFLFTKGSDQRLLNDGEKDIKEIVNNAGDYRSLVLRCREMSRAEAEGLRRTEDRDLLRAAHRASEYLGSTFIEDELQEQVAETMDALHRAGIRIWMITGDKQETAICCARNAGIVGTLPSIVMEGCEVVRMLEQELAVEHRESSQFQPQSPDTSQEAESRPESRDERISRLFEAESLVIYRATPAQKGQITALLASEKKHVLAIGDGNNDVAMLKGAHVGVGILGKEGTQASFAADFAIPRFMLLRNLILVHGRYNLIRYSKISLNAFYKNILFIFVQFFYNFVNCASGFPIYNEFFMNYYNLFFTSLIPFSIALFDRDISQRGALLSPESYCLARAHFSRRLMCANVAFGVFQATLIYFVFYSIINLDICSINGIPSAYGGTSTFFSIAVFFATILRQYRQISFVVKYSNIALALSVMFMIVLLFGLQDILVSSNSAVYMLLRMPAAYLVLAAVGSLIFMSEVFFDVLSECLINKTGYEPA